MENTHNTTNNTNNTNNATTTSTTNDAELTHQLEKVNALRLELDSEHPLIREAISSLALIYSKRHEYDLSAKMWEEVLTFPADTKSALYAMHSLACTYNILGQHSKALRIHLDTMEFCKCMLEWDHPCVGTYTHYVAEGYRQTGEIDIALELELEVLQFRERFLAKDHPDLDSTRSIIAELYKCTGQHELSQNITNQRVSLTGEYQNEWDLYDSYTDSSRVHTQKLESLKEIRKF